MYEREISYRGAVIRVEWDLVPSARLFINNLERAADVGESSNKRVIRLSSTVQTDYEWHEFIEAVIRFEEDQSVLVLTANKETLIDDIERIHKS